MTGTAAKTPRLDLATNIPVVMTIKYVDVWPDTNGYGSQVSLKGTVGGDTVVSYLKGKSWANLKALAEAGVIGPYDKSVEEPSEKTNLPVLHGDNVTLCRQQLPGEKYANLVVTTATAKAPAAKPSVQPKGADIGGPIPGLDDDDDLPPPVDQAFEDATQRPGNKMDALFQLYGVCFDEAARLANKHAALKPDVSAIAATLYIAASR